MTTMTTNTNTDRIEKSILLRAPLPRVWRAISNANEFGSWFGIKFENGPFAPGAVMRGVIVPSEASAEVAKAQKKYEGTPMEITIEKMEPERLFSFRWHPYAIERNVDYSAEPTTLIEFVLKQAPEGVTLTITETGFDRIPLERRAKAFAANDGGWSMMIKVIGEYVANAR